MRRWRSIFIVIGSVLLAAVLPVLSVNTLHALLRRGAVAPNNWLVGLLGVYGGVAVGACCLAALPISAKARIVLTGVFVLIAVPLTVLYAIGKACAEFGRCL